VRYRRGHRDCSAGPRRPLRSLLATPHEPWQLGAGARPIGGAARRGSPRRPHPGRQRRRGGLLVPGSAPASRARGGGGACGGVPDAIVSCSQTNRRLCVSSPGGIRTLAPFRAVDLKTLANTLTRVFPVYLTS